MKIPLFLASSSESRKALLSASDIPFSIISQTSNESYDAHLTNPQEIVRAIAHSKMDFAIIPKSVTYCIVLSADTICVTNDGQIKGKPTSLEEARLMLKEWRTGCTVITAFCLEKKEFREGKWVPRQTIEEQISSHLILSISDEWIDIYLDRAPYRQLAGALAVEEFGMQFVKSIQGSYSNIMGLPLCEVRLALEQFGFF